jgi:O-antigen/teichoic acid export membrane protein
VRSLRGDRTIKRLLARNIVWNWAGMVAGMLVGFLVAPFLVHRLGQSLYGLWILIASFTNYFGLLDLGIRGSVGRNIAYFRARGDRDEVNATLATALALLCGAGLIALLGTLALLPVFPRLFDVPAEQLGEARLALLLVGLNLALWLPLNVFDATLWAYQRFDLLNAIDIPAALLRLALTFWLVGAGHGLVALALINLLTLVGAQAVKGLVSFRLDRDLRLRRGDVKAVAARRLYGYGLWYFLLSLSRMVTNQMSPILIGLLLGVAWVVVFSIASRLIGYAVSLLVAATGVLTPAATALHAGDRREEQRQMFLGGGKCCLALALAVLTVFFFLGGPLVVLWMGSELAAATPLLLILAVGEVLPMSQLATNSMVLALGRHKPLALLGLAENVAAVALAVVLAPAWGLAGVCVAFAATGTLFRGVAQMVYGCWLLKVSPRQYLVRAILPAVGFSLPPTLLLAALVSWHTPASWPGLIACTLLYGLAFAVAGVFLLGGLGRLRGGRTVEAAPARN